MKTFLHVFQSASNLTEVEIPPESQPHNIRQLFVTKNLVLCNEVQKTFCEMRNATRNTSTVNTGEKPVPEKFDDFHNDDFPVFLTSKKLLMMIDASLPNPFFKRDSSGKLLVSVQNYSTRLFYIIGDTVCLLLIQTEYYDRSD